MENVNDALKLVCQVISVLKDTDNLDRDNYNYSIKLLEKAVDKLAS